MDQTPIFEYVAPLSASLEPPRSSQAILVVSYELHPSLIAMVQEKPFSRDEDENPYTHLRDFEQLCSFIHIQGMRWDTLKWKLFPFSLTGIAKRWYTHHICSVIGKWEKLQSKFCLTFFPISCVAHLRRDILNFKQKEESLGAAWAHLIDLVSSSLYLAIAEPTML
jgi:hypothetical protein